jgi:hypothetical protein
MIGVTAQAKTGRTITILKFAKRKHNYSMEPFQLPSDEEIGAAYGDGKEAVVALFHRTISQLATRVQALEDRGQRTVGIAANRRPFVCLSAENLTALLSSR